MRERPIATPGAQVSPGAALGVILGAPDLAQFGGRECAGEPLEHAAGADRGQLRGVADQHELRPGAVRQRREARQALGVGHASLVQVDRRVRADLQRAVLRAGDERVQRQGPPGERGAVTAEALRRRARDRGPVVWRPCGLFGPGGGVDHDALPGPGGPDKHGGTLRPRGDGERMPLLLARASRRSALRPTRSPPAAIGRSARAVGVRAMRCRRRSTSRSHSLAARVVSNAAVKRAAPCRLSPSAARPRARRSGRARPRTARA